MAELGIALAGAAVAGGGAAALGATTAGIMTAVSVGFQVASILGNILFPPEGQNMKGPRLGDLKVTVSTYGASVQWGWGTWRGSGNVTLMPKVAIREVAKTESPAGGGLFGKGGGSQTYTTYSYFATLEVAWGEGVGADDITMAMIMLWADTKIIYDNRAGQKVQKKYKKMDVEFRDGNETQLPHAFWEAEYGVGEIPGGRGIASTFLKDLPLEDFGNRIPNFTALLTRSATPNNFLERQYSGVGAGFYVGDGFSGYGHNLVVDRDRAVGFAYFLNYDANGVAHNQVGKFDLLTNTFLFYTGLDEQFSGGGAHDISQDGFVVALHNFSSRNIAVLDPVTLEVIAESFETVGIASGLFSDKVSGLNNVWTFNGAVLGGGDTLLRCFTVTVDPLTQEVEVKLVGYADTLGAGYGRVRGIEGVDSNGNAWVMSFTSYLIKITPTGEMTGFNLSGTYPPSQIPAHLFYDETTHSVIIQSGTTLRKWDIESSTLGPAVVLGGLNGSSFFQRIPPLEGKVWFTVGAPSPLGVLFAEFDVVTMAYTGKQFYSSEVPGAGLSGYLSAVYMPQFNSVIADFQFGLTRFGYDQIYIDRAIPGTVLLKTIVADESRHAGLLADRDITAQSREAYVEELLDIVPGYAVARQGPATVRLAPLAQAYFFDECQGDDKIKYVKRGKEPEIIIPQRELSAHEAGSEMPEPMEKTLAQITELPKAINVQYWRKDYSYQDGSQQFKTELGETKDEKVLEVPVAEADRWARRVAERVMHTLHVNADKRDIALSNKYLMIEPTTVIGVELEEEAEEAMMPGQETPPPDVDPPTDSPEEPPPEPEDPPDNIPGASNVRYASPTGGGSGLNSGSPYKVEDFWPDATPDSQLILLAGTYTGDDSMIIPPANLSGTSGNRIYITAQTDGAVLIDGQNARHPCELNNNKYFELEGINFANSSGVVVYFKNNSSFTNARRCIAWNANPATNVNVWQVSSPDCLLEDCGGFGTGRKIFSSSQGGDRCIRRRCWGMWERSTMDGPKSVFDACYNARNEIVENCVATWNQALMGSAAVDQPYGLFATIGPSSGSYMMNSKMLGCIGYLKASDQCPTWLGGIFGSRACDGLEFRDMAIYIEPGSHTNLRPILGQKFDGGSSSIGASASGGNRKFINCTEIGGGESSISSDPQNGWTKTNHVDSSSVGNAPNIWTGSGTQGSRNRYRYLNGALTGTPLLPWPLDSGNRLRNALTAGGKNPDALFGGAGNGLTELLEKIFGDNPDT